MLAAAAVLALAVPAAAGAARPSKTSFLNDNASNGAYVVNTAHTITTLSLFCSGSTYADREFRFDVYPNVSIGRDGSFSYNGTAYRLGPESQPRSHFKIKLSGHFTSSDTVVIKRTLTGCKSGTVVAKAQR